MTPLNFIGQGSSSFTTSALSRSTDASVELWGVGSAVLLGGPSTRLKRLPKRSGLFGWAASSWLGQPAADQYRLHCILRCDFFVALLSLLYILSLSLSLSLSIGPAPASSGYWLFAQCPLYLPGSRRRPVSHGVSDRVLQSSVPSCRCLPYGY